MAQDLLQVDALKVAFTSEKREVHAVDGISFDIKKGEILALVGESGCGKSVTSLAIMGLLPENGRVTSGQIRFCGEDLCQKTPNEMSRIRGNDISMIFQEPMTSFNPVLTIGEQLMEGILLHTKVSKKQAREQAIETLKLVGFPRAEQVMFEYPHLLSGGMRQRAMIAMAMAMRPQLLIADEPTTALDVTIQAQILELMRRVRDQFGTSILLITHDLGVVAEMADRVVVMYAGKMVEEARIEELFEQPSHPYTEGLLRSVPRLEEEQVRLHTIPGQVPSLGEQVMGCLFSPRCDRVFEPCCHEEPELTVISSEHKVRCFLYSSSNSSSRPTLKEAVTSDSAAT